MARWTSEEREPGLSGGLEGELVADRVEVDYGGGPCCLQSDLCAADGPGLAGVGAVCERAEQPPRPRPGAAEVRGGGGIVERLPGGDQELLFGVDIDHPEVA